MLRGQRPRREGTSFGPVTIPLQVVMLSVFIGACTPAHVSRVRDSGEVEREPSAVAVIAMERFALGAKSSDPEKTAACVRGAIVRERPWVPVISQEEFLQVAFPGLELGEVPSEPKYVELLLDDDEFRERIESMRLGFLVVVGGLKKTRDLWGSVYCGAGPGGAACLGVDADEEETHLAATVFSIASGGRRKDVAASWKGREYWGVILIVPFVKPAATMPAACREVAAEILRVVDEFEATPNQGVADPNPGRSR